jgi:SPP1 gp7 family putative phage head morphogenesis protein
MATNNDLLFDANAQHQLFVIQVSEQAARQSLPILSEARQYILNQLGRVSTLETKKQLRELNRRIEKRLLQIYKKYPTLLEKNNREFIKAEYEFQKNSITQAIEGQAVALPAQKAAQVATANTPMQVGSKGASVTLSTLLASFAPQEAKRVTDRITAGFYNGETVGDISRAITGTKRQGYRDGIMNISKANAFTMAKTGITHLQTQAKEQVYKDNDDIIAGYEIVATLDSRTSQICRSLDGQVFPIGGRHPMPPFHYNCRSTTSPVLKEEFQSDVKTTRPSESGAVSANKTYYSWLKDQPASFQNEALGVEQGKIFRNAGLTPEEFRKVSVDKFYQPRTISQMAQADEKIAEYVSKQMQ